MHEWRKEQKRGADGWKGGNRKDGQLSWCQVVGRQLQVTLLPSCQCEHHPGLTCWLRGDGRLEVCDPRVRKPLLRRHYSKLLLQLKRTCWKQACVHTLMSKVCGSWRLSTELPMRLSFCCMLQTCSGKKGGIILPFGGCRGGRKESSSQTSLSLARTSCSAAALLTLNALGRACVSLAWTVASRNTTGREWCASVHVECLGLQKKSFFRFNWVIIYFF